MKSVPHSQAWIRHAKVRRLRCRLRCCVCVRVCCYTEILQGEHVLFGVVKWKLDAQLHTSLARCLYFLSLCVFVDLLTY